MPHGPSGCQWASRRLSASGQVLCGSWSGCQYYSKLAPRVADSESECAQELATVRRLRAPAPGRHGHGHGGDSGAGRGPDAAKRVGAVPHVQGHAPWVERRRCLSVEPPPFASLIRFFRTAFAGHSPIGRQFSSMIRAPMIDAGL
jgi:hypothetical protein